MNNFDELSDEERVRRARRRRLKQIKRRRRRIRGIIMLSASLILFIMLCVGIIKGIVGVIRHFSNNDNVAASNDYESDVSGNITIYGDSSDSSSQGSTSQLNISISSDYVDITDDDVLAPYAVLLDADTYEVVAGREYDTIIYPASMTKVMTLIVAVEHMDDIASSYTFTYEDIAPLVAADASRAGFKEGETVQITDILYGLILPSGADAAVGLANAVAGSEEAFAVLMNEKCEELGLTDTHFTNPSGLYDSTQVTTCAQMAAIMAYAMQNELCAKVLSTYQYTTAPTEQNPDGIELTSTMFSRMYGDEVDGVSIIAGKTGYTVEAGNCMVSYATKDDKSYVCVTASSTNKWHCIYDAFEIFGQYIP